MAAPERRIFLSGWSMDQAVEWYRDMLGPEGPIWLEQGDGGVWIIA